MTTVTKGEIPTRKYSFPVFKTVENDLTEYFGTQHMFDVLSEKKSYMQYFNERVFFTIDYSAVAKKKQWDEMQTNMTLQVLEDYLKSRRKQKFFLPRTSSSQNQFMEYIYNLIDHEYTKNK